METVKTSPQEQMMQIIMSKITSRSVSLVAKLSIADHLADGPHDANTLADKAGIQPDILYRVLRTLAAVGIFRELPLPILFAKFV